MNNDEINEPIESTQNETHSSTPEERIAHESQAPAIPPPTGGGSWSQGRTSKDNAKSPMFGICLGQDMDAREIGPLPRGARVTIGIPKGDAIQTLTGRASRPRTAYYRKDELAALGIGLHDRFLYSILSINGASPQASVAQPEPEPDTLSEASQPTATEPTAVGEPEVTDLPDYELPHELADTAPPNPPAIDDDDDLDWGSNNNSKKSEDV